MHFILAFDTFILTWKFSFTLQTDKEIFLSLNRNTNLLTYVCARLGLFFCTYVQLLEKFKWKSANQNDQNMRLVWLSPKYTDTTPPSNIPIPFGCFLERYLCTHATYTNTINSQNNAKVCCMSRKNTTFFTSSILLQSFG